VPKASLVISATVPGLTTQYPSSTPPMAGPQLAGHGPYRAAAAAAAFERYILRNDNDRLRRTVTQTER